jgi:hypothetical protein
MCAIVCAPLPAASSAVLVEEYKAEVAAHPGLLDYLRELDKNDEALQLVTSKAERARLQRLLDGHRQDPSNRGERSMSLFTVFRRGRLRCSDAAPF